MRTTVLPALALLLAPAFACAQSPEAPPQATPFTIGTLPAASLRDRLNIVPNDGSVFGIGQSPRAVAGVLRAAGAPTDVVTLSVDALLVRTPGHVALFDTGLGPKAGGVLLRSLALAGVAPDQITDVFLTHSHPDHIGGLVDASGRSAFRNATIRLSGREWSVLQNRKSTEAVVAAVAAQVKTFAPGSEVIPGVVAVALPGHTPGHVGYRIGAGGGQLFDMGDTAHSAIVSLARPGWAIGYDGDKAQGRATREAELKRLAASGERIFAPHFPYPGVGRIVAKGTGYAFVPGVE